MTPFRDRDYLYDQEGILVATLYCVCARPSGEQNTICQMCDGRIPLRTTASADVVDTRPNRTVRR